MINVKKRLLALAAENGLAPALLQLPDCEVAPETTRVMMINEVPPTDPAQGFYNTAADSDYMRSTLGLFHAAGVQVNSMQDILDFGIYITTAVKSPKTGYTVEPGVIQAHLPLLKGELGLFPQLQVIMCMGDVAKKTVNMIVKADTGKNVIPSGATGRLRHNEYWWGDMRVFPSYIMTGKNLLIEPFKRDCVAEDIGKMMALVHVPRA